MINGPGVNRQVKNTIIPDNLILGLTITNNIPAKDLDKMFQSPNKLSESASLTPDSKEEVVEKQVEDLASLLQIMLELLGRVDKLETEVRTCYRRIIYINRLPLLNFGVTLVLR